METGIQLKAFVGYSFADQDEALTDKIIRHIEGYDILCKTGEKAQNKFVSQKVKERIDECDFFVGIFTKGLELCGEVSDKGVFARFCKGKASRSGLFMTSNWVIQESGYALGKGKPLLLMVEQGIHNFPELQGDQEIIPFESLTNWLSVMSSERNKRMLFKPTSGLSNCARWTTTKYLAL